MICRKHVFLILTSQTLVRYSLAGVQPEKREFYSGNVREKVQMGVANVKCDDGVNYLEVDWRDDPVNHTCYHPTTPLLTHDHETQVTCDNVPDQYSPRHFCMNQQLSYNVSVPTAGDHRPIWPKFGEYK